MTYFIIRSLEHGLIFGILVLGVFITYRVLDFPDLTVDGSFPLGAAVSAILIFNGVHPAISLIFAVIAGILAGLCTGILHTKFKISNLLSGILVMIGLYSINLRVMGRANIPLLAKPTIFRQFHKIFNGPYSNLIILFIITLTIKLLLDQLFKTRLGLTLRAAGDNQQMATNLAVNPTWMILLGLATSNGLVALSGAMVAQLQGFADVGMGIGTVVTGLASVILGQAVFRTKRFSQATTAVLIGSILYRAAIRASLNLGIAPSDLKLITSLLVILALIIPQTRWIKSVNKLVKGGGINVKA
ncbi:MAG: ABC transporter permease [Halanaerobiales bacterium]|nr:ABC transporter permease [Halanaerobiales bacterium]